MDLIARGWGYRGSPKHGSDFRLWHHESRVRYAIVSFHDDYCDPSSDFLKSTFMTAPGDWGPDNFMKHELKKYWHDLLLIKGFGNGRVYDQL